MGVAGEGVGDGPEPMRGARAIPRARGALTGRPVVWSRPGGVRTFSETAEPSSLTGHLWVALSFLRRGLVFLYGLGITVGDLGGGILGLAAILRVFHGDPFSIFDR